MQSLRFRINRLLYVVGLGLTPIVTKALAQNALWASILLAGSATAILCCGRAIDAGRPWTIGLIPLAGLPALFVAIGATMANFRIDNPLLSSMSLVAVTAWLFVMAAGVVFPVWLATLPSEARR